jgi:hypothetical protein
MSKCCREKQVVNLLGNWLPDKKTFLQHGNPNRQHTIIVASTSTKKEHKSSIAMTGTWVACDGLVLCDVDSKLCAMVLHGSLVDVKLDILSAGNCSTAIR